MNSATLVQKLWNCRNVLRDDGMSYGDYVELIAPGQNSTRRRFAQPKIWVIGSEDELGA